MSATDNGVVFAHFSESGPRPRNDDSCVASTLPDGRVVLAVADGIGGLDSGHLASRTAVKEMLRGLGRGATLADAVQSANEALVNVREDGPTGTTLVAAISDGRTVSIANVGDSRGYMITDLGLDQVTTDHTVGAEAQAAGVDPAELGADRWAGSLTRSLGEKSSVTVDMFGPFPIAEGHYLILCSDGVHGVLSRAEFEETVRDCDSPESVPRALVTTALEQGSEDNATAVMLYRSPSGNGDQLGRPRNRHPLDVPWDPTLTVSRSYKSTQTGLEKRWILVAVALCAALATLLLSLL